MKKNYGKKKKIKIIRSNKQLYFTGGSNLGAKNARGEKLIFLNSDTVVDKNWIKELVKFANGHNQYLIQPKILFYNQKDIIDNVGGKYTFFGFGYGIGRGETDCEQYDENRQVDYVNATAFMIDKDFFWKLGGFDECFRYFYEDVDLSLRAKKVDGKSWYCYQSVVYHKGSLSFKKNVSKKVIFYYLQRNRLITFLKNKILLHLKHFSQMSKHKFLINWLRFWELKFFIKRRKFSLLDLGCGDGSFLHLARQHGINALGVEKTPLPHPHIIVSSIKDLKLDKKFDVVVMFHVLEHLKNPEASLKQIMTLLKKDGILVIEVPLIGNFTEKFLQKDYFAYHDKSHVNFFTKNKLLSLLNKTGFVVKRKGCTLLEFPFTVLTSGFKKGIIKELTGLIFFLPLKLLSIFGFNDEIIRLYCVV
ncbi:hypothetical protein COU96_02320 [Candidatus Shapirobacteria bacterium CG10_big_fil_rev_8_21_14_0_10_38_14]|uniref:Glycosyltransferase 2-like domain-containing protein n=1 Tax=Candidatus Shapirobacteria bacterium CG10_big_fil_rev_8_21_14_0_10_38_14 TaxID=1974483 RepID=A0A2M8L555_9BACT|nr:MAG: hypothetical protein COU96_02320 [Candidatus Shapirobacteria bacterium CG10_big_fil_rev_8_21_14_0_10_38_14]